MLSDGRILVRSIRISLRIVAKNAVRQSSDNEEGRTVEAILEKVFGEALQDCHSLGIEY